MHAVLRAELAKNIADFTLTEASLVDVRPIIFLIHPAYGDSSPNFRREISYVCPFLVSIALLRYEASMTSDSGSHDKTAGGANHFPGDPGRFV